MAVELLREPIRGQLKTIINKEWDFGGPRICIYYTSPVNDMFIFLQGSPADKAGIETRDVITHINGVEIFDTGNVYELLETPEDLHVTLIRDNIQKLVTVRPDF